MTEVLRRGTRLGSEIVEFRFDGVSYRGQRGDCAASALWAAGVRLMNRSIKYRRPRSFIALGAEEPNALVTVGSPPNLIPNVPAPQLRIRPGLELRSQNRWPSLRYDLAAALLSPGASLWAAGFYYKTFMWPSWRTFEPLIRKLAGLGYAPAASDLPNVPVRHLSADVVIAGAGAAGLIAALRCARSGLRVIVVEREPVLGGELEFEAALLDGKPALEWVAQVHHELEARQSLILTSTTLITTSDGLYIALGQPHGLPGTDTLYRLQAPQFINAMGAVERGIAFIDNDRPGVMLSGAGERLLACYGAVPGTRVVLFGNHNRLYATALRLLAAGVGVASIVDTREAPTSALREQLKTRGVECLTHHAVVRAQGDPVLRAASVVSLARPNVERRLACDALLVSGGWTPYVYPDLQQGGQAVYRADIGGYATTNQPAWRRACGAAAGAADLAAVTDGALAAANDVIDVLGRARDSAALTSPSGYDEAPGLVPFFRSPASYPDEKRQFVDPQNDVTVADLRQALAEGFVDIEHVKRYTTLGVGTEQGRTGGLLGAAIIAELRGLPAASVGVSRSRGPYQPVPMQALVGHRTATELRPARRSALHDLHAAAQGELELMSGWLRPRYYRDNGSDAGTASVTEAARVRQHGGICDASTLGKIEIAGADAPAFIDRLYLGKPSAIAVHRSRYAVLLREDGMVLDDGLLLRVHPERFVATTSSSHLAHVLSHLEFHRATEFAGRAVAITDVTECWSVIVAAGPASRATLRELLGGSFASAIDGLAHMGMADGVWGGGRLRLVRASFSGELAYELHCQPSIAPILWTRLMGAGLRPFGLEALDVLRVEKGYLTSSELNGQTNPLDVRLDRLVSAAPDAVGVPLLKRPAFSDPERPILVGLVASDGHAVIRGGAQLTESADSVHSVGYVTSSVYSPARAQYVALALVARRLADSGHDLHARDPLRGGDARVQVVPTVHFDPTHERLRS